MKLEGKVALVTGAGRGIGRAIALLFAQEGADIAVNDIERSLAEETAGVVQKMGRKAVAIKADVAQADEVDAMVATVIKELGGVHILVNNAGVPPLDTPTLSVTSMEGWDRIIAVNLRGTYLCSRQVGEWMVAQKTGKIVNISSIGGIAAAPGTIAYSATKAGIINMTRSLAVEWAQYNINVNCIAPAVVRTYMWDRILQEGVMTVAEIEKRSPMGRLAEPEDIARAALFLASDDASFITGVTLPVDGGWLAYGYQTV